MALSRESGFLGQVQSLGGLWSKIGSGRISEQLNHTVTTTAVLDILTANQRRISALIVNRGTGVLKLDFGSSGVYGTAVASGASMQIDALFPWTGIVSAIAETNNCTVYVVEVSIEQS